MFLGRVFICLAECSFHCSPSARLERKLSVEGLTNSVSVSNLPIHSTKYTEQFQVTRAYEYEHRRMPACLPRRIPFPLHLACAFPSHLIPLLHTMCAHPACISACGRHYTIQAVAFDLLIAFSLIFPRTHGFRSTTIPAVIK